MNAKSISVTATIGSLLFLASVPFSAHATLSYENVDGVGLIYDSVENVTWTQDGNISGDTFDFQDAQNWAANLSLAGVGASNWQLPDSDQFTSLFAQLESTNDEDKYGAQVFFGEGPNDFATNVVPEYWTDADGTDFNFYYGYPGSQPDSNDYGVWALTTATIPTPEPSTLAYSALTLGLIACKRCPKWKPLSRN